MSVTVFADLSLRTPAFVVQDEAGEAITREITVPPLGGGLTVVTNDAAPHALSFTGAFHSATGNWETVLAWAPTTWTFVADAGWRYRYGRATDGTGVYTDLGAGLRYVWLAQPWFSDYVAYGVGEHFAVGYALPSRWTVELRVETCFTLAEVDGELDTALEDMSWTWRPSSLRAAFRVGREFR